MQQAHKHRKACGPCIALKAKCDQARPCTRCAGKGLGHLCNDVDRKSRPKKLKLSETQPISQENINQIITLAEMLKQQPLTPLQLLQKNLEHIQTIQNAQPTQPAHNNAQPVPQIPQYQHTTQETQNLPATDTEFKDLLYTQLQFQQYTQNPPTLSSQVFSQVPSPSFLNNSPQFLQSPPFSQQPEFSPLPQYSQSEFTPQPQSPFPNDALSFLPLLSEVQDSTTLNTVSNTQNAIQTTNQIESLALVDPNNNNNNNLHNFYIKLASNIHNLLTSPLANNNTNVLNFLNTNNNNNNDINNAHFSYNELKLVEEKVGQIRGLLDSFVHQVDLKSRPTLGNRPQVIVCPSKTMLIDCNQEFAQMLGRTQESLRGETVTSLTPPFIQKIIRRDIQFFLKNGLPKGERFMSFKHSNGGYVYAQSNIQIFSKDYGVVTVLEVYNEMPPCLKLMFEHSLGLRSAHSKPPPPCDKPYCNCKMLDMPLLPEDQ